MDSDRFRYSAANCSIARTLGVVGEKWTLLVLREAFYGIRRFDDFHAALGCARNLLATRLKTLVTQGILERTAYRDDVGRSRDEYRLTDKGRDLWPVITTMRQWGDKHAAPDGPPLELVHERCGHISDARMICSSCGEGIGPRDVRALPGPGAVERLIRTA